MKGLIPKAGSGILNWASKNTTTILTWLNSAGVIVTALTAIDAYRKSNNAIIDAELEDAPVKEQIKEVWPYWIAPTLSAAVTIGCGIGVDRLHHNKELAMIAAYDVFKSQAMQFREHAIEEIGKNKVKKIEHDIHSTELSGVPEPSEDLQEICDVSTGGILLYDRYTGQYIKTTYEKVFRAAENVNAKLRPYGSGGRDWYSHADFIVDCGGEYAEGCEKWGYIARPFGDPLDVNDICDVHIQEYKNHRCTIVYLNVLPDEKDFL